jgi:hypothetical protein
MCSTTRLRNGILSSTRYGPLRSLSIRPTCSSGLFSGVGSLTTLLNWTRSWRGCRTICSGARSSPEPWQENDSFYSLAAASGLPLPFFEARRMRSLLNWPAISARPSKLVHYRGYSPYMNKLAATSIKSSNKSAPKVVSRNSLGVQ